MSRVTDILLDQDFDVQEEGGDIPTGEATFQHQAVIMKAMPGSFKQSPTMGIGVDTFLLDETPDQLMREVRRQFTLDGMRVSRANVDAAGNFDIKATY